MSDYLREAVAAEGLVGSSPSFSESFRAASLSDGRTVGYTSIAGNLGVSNDTVKGYFRILEDTLIGCLRPAHRKLVNWWLAVSESRPRFNCPEGPCLPAPARSERALKRL